MAGKIKVMLSTEGTYPFHQGGVSTWCDILVQKMPEYEFVLYSIIMNPYVTQKFTLPPNTKLIKVPLWGTEEPSENLTIPFSQVFLSKRRTTPKVIKEEFMPLFTELIDEFAAKVKNSARLGRVLLKLHDFFEEYEYKAAFKSKIVWECFKEQVLKLTLEPDSGLDEPNIFALTQSLGWIYRFLNVINTPIPEVDVAHSSAAAFCGIPCVLAKLKYGTPFILTEHGVYLREQYFSLSSRGYISYMNTFLIRMIQSVTSLNYFYADQVSPVCNYNTRWEKQFGVREKNIKVIYNGVDKDVYAPGNYIRTDKSPTVVSVARIDPLKDIKTLLQSAALLVKKIPDVKFLVYGSVSVESYYKECMELKASLGLGDNFVFKGHTSDVPAAYRSGDIVVLSSISEAFPYSVVEAMLTGKPVVATDVGGIKEALGDGGILVEPRNPQQLSDGMEKLLSDNLLREEMAQEARDRALNFFTLDRVLEMYNLSYGALAAGNLRSHAFAVRIKRQQIVLERAYALADAGFNIEAIHQFKEVLAMKPPKHLVPVILGEVSNLMLKEGMLEEAILNKDKAEILMDYFSEKVG